MHAQQALSCVPAPLSALYFEKGGGLTSFSSWDYGPVSLDPARKWKHCLFSALSKKGQMPGNQSNELPGPQGGAFVPIADTGRPWV